MSHPQLHWVHSDSLSKQECSEDCLINHVYHLYPRFLHDQNSSAFKFYRKKVFELCPSICFTSSPLNPHASESSLEPMEEEGEFADEPPQQEVELESLEVMPEEEEEEEDEEEEEGGEEAPTPEGSSKAIEEAAKSEGSEGSPRTDGLPSEAAEDGPAGTSALSQSSSGACFPRKRVSSKSLKVGMIPAPKRLCLIQEPKGECHHQCSTLLSLLFST